MTEKKTTTRKANPRDKKIGHALKTIRGSRSQSWLAKEMQDRGHRWSQSTIWAIENGYQAAKITEAIDLSEILGFDMSILASANEAMLSEIRTDLANVANMRNDLVHDIGGWLMSKASLEYLAEQYEDLQSDEHKELRQMIGAEVRYSTDNLIRDGEQQMEIFVNDAVKELKGRDS